MDMKDGTPIGEWIYGLFGFMELNFSSYFFLYFSP
jgi:hypothetical protein